MRLPLWHITDNPEWVLDPEYRPRYAYWTASEVENPPGLYVSEHPLYWKPYFGRGPLWAVRIAYHAELPRIDLQHPQYLLTELDKIEVLEVIPLAEAIRKGQAEALAGINWDQRYYNDFESVEDWWYACRKVWNDRTNRDEDICRPRRGLEGLMKEWKDAHGGRTPQQVYQWRERFKKRWGHYPRSYDEPWRT